MLKGSARRYLIEMAAQGRPENLDAIRAIVTDCGVLESVYHTARKYVDQAVEELTILPDGPEREALNNVAKFVVERHV